MGSQKIKHDKDKLPLAYVPPAIIEAIGAVRKYGIDKYDTTDGWQEVEAERFAHAMMRHVCKWLRNPYSVDNESGLPHLWHVACNIAFILEKETLYKNDDV